MTLIWLISSYKSEKIELIWSFKNHIIHVSIQKVAKVSQFTFRLVKSYKLFSVRPPLEILRNFQKNHFQKQPPEVFHKKFFSNILRYSQENTCVGVSFLIKLQAISPVTLLKHGLKRDSNTDISCDYREIYNNT